MKLLKILILSLTISCSQMGQIGELFQDPEIAVSGNSYSLVMTVVKLNN